MTGGFHPLLRPAIDAALERAAEKVIREALANIPPGSRELSTDPWQRMVEITGGPVPSDIWIRSVGHIGSAWPERVPELSADGSKVTQRAARVWPVIVKNSSLLTETPMWWELEEQTDKDARPSAILVALGDRLL